MKVQNAFDKLSEQKSFSAELGFAGSADDIYAAMKNEDDFERADATMLAGLKVKFSAASDTQLKDTKNLGKGSVSFALSNGSADLIEVRSVGQMVYLRADLKAVSALDTSSKGSDSKELDTMLKQADQLPASMSAVKNALKGKWIGLDPKTFAAFIKQSGLDKEAGLPDTGSALDPAQQKKAIEAVKKALGENAKFKDAPGKDGVDHVTVTVAGRKAAQDLVDALKPFPQFKDAFKDFKPSDVPDKDIAIDLAVKDGMLSGISLDVAQFDTKSTGKLPLSITIDGKADPVTAPSGSVELKPQDLMSAMMFLVAGQEKA
ncbi:hypothetical protein [Streptomyces beijiangensis]|uniref:Uncharacterized protein n=1 Tax=Streptomyces beijiangensis TaxID=163361 RepID=A0A939F2G0_9ACTN|nr:hypothetical protein [Streptomyces beijiangensis]MBO0510892.1 hypothetical protein [Streptomyces beijiangensis]